MKLAYYEKKFSDYIEEQELLPEITSDEDNLLQDEKDLIVLTSGGKDSSALVTLLEAHRKKHELKVTYLNIMFPHDMYGEDVMAKQEALGHGLEHFSSIIPSAPRDVLAKLENPCRKCKEVRAQEVDRFVKNKPTTDLVIMTAHTQDDLIAYFTEFFNKNMEETLNKFPLEELPRISLNEEQLEHFSRFFSKLVLDSGVTLIKPLLTFNTREVKDINSITGNKKHVCSCMYYCLRPKRNLFQAVDSLSTVEAKDFYEHYDTKKLQETLKNKVENYDWAIKKIKEQAYTLFLV